MTSNVKGERTTVARLLSSGKEDKVDAGELEDGGDVEMPPKVLKIIPFRRFFPSISI